MRVYANSRSKILAAAEALVIEQGAGKLTLDAVAKRAGISKGGLIHNFASKQELLAAMVEQLIQSYEQRLADKVKQGAVTPVDQFKASLQVGMHFDAQFLKVSAGILAAVSDEPQLLEPVRLWYKKHYEKLAHSQLDFPQAAILSLATDGIYLLSLLGLLSLTDEQKHQVEQAILKIADQCQK